MDSRHCHLFWGASLGGVSYPLLSDFHPKGEMAQAYSAYLPQAGITQRATVLVDAGGKVLFSEAVTSGREMPALVEQMKALVASSDAQTVAPQAGEALADDAMLYVRDNCAASRAVMATATNLHLDGLTIANVSQDANAKATLKALTGQETAPVLVEGGAPLAESTAIIEELVKRQTGWF